MPHINSSIITNIMYNNNLIFESVADKSKLAHSFKYIDREIHLIEILLDESVYKSTLTKPDAVF